MAAKVVMAKPLRPWPIISVFVLFPISDSYVLKASLPSVASDGTLCVDAVV